MNWWKMRRMNRIMKNDSEIRLIKKYVFFIQTLFHNGFVWKSHKMTTHLNSSNTRCKKIEKLTEFRFITVNLEKHLKFLTFFNESPKEQLGIGSKYYIICINIMCIHGKKSGNRSQKEHAQNGLKKKYRKNFIFFLLFLMSLRSNSSELDQNFIQYVLI